MRFKTVALRVLSISATIATLMPLFPAYAAEDDSDMSVYTVNLSENDVQTSIKEQAITDTISENTTTEEESKEADLDASNVSVDYVDEDKSGMQVVTLPVQAISSDNEVTTLAVKKATVTVKQDNQASITLNNDEITIDNGAEWDPLTAIQRVYDLGTDYPVLKVDNNVDTTIDGTYDVHYTVIGYNGSKSEENLTVHVQTPPEVIAAREEAARLEQERLEQERIKQEREEAEQKAAAQRQAQQASVQATYTEANNPQQSAEGNPYFGGWSNCVWSAWELTYEITGIQLPNLGSASNWLSAARANGYGTGSTPAVNSIAVYNGHVAFVAAVDDDRVYIKEGGYNGGYHERWVSATGTKTKTCLGYIYLS